LRVLVCGEGGGGRREILVCARVGDSFFFRLGGGVWEIMVFAIVSVMVCYKVGGDGGNWCFCYS